MNGPGIIVDPNEKHEALRKIALLMDPPHENRTISGIILITRWKDASDDRDFYSIHAWPSNMESIRDMLTATVERYFRD